MADKQYKITTSMGSGWKVTADVRGHQLVIDQPTATDEGANPLETFLFSLAGCLSAIAKMVAREDGITLRGIDIDVTGILNPAGLAGKPTDDPIGFKSIDATARIDADLSDDEKRVFFDKVCHRCPVHHNLLHPTVVTHSA